MKNIWALYFISLYYTSLCLHVPVSVPVLVQLGNAFMQWYGQDVASASYSTSSHSHSEEEASTTATGEEKDGAIGVNVRKGAKQVLESPYDFSVDPDAPDADGHSLPPAGDFFW